MSLNPPNTDRRIQKLEKHVSEQITSQQIIPTLHECIKELVDNSIDAKASVIKIELQEYGKVNFSVFDNGSGIREVEKLGEGGNTSKLRIDESIMKSDDYLEGIRTLGFRGQAVNSIANLCKEMVIHTVYESHINDPNMDNRQNNGDSSKMIEAKYSATKKTILERRPSFSKQTFTKISVEGLFYTLPVRKHQLDSKPKQNIKRVYELIFQISLIYPEVTFILTNIVQGKQELLFNIQRNLSSKATNNNNGNLHIKSEQSDDYFHLDLPQQAWRQRIQICFPNKLNDSLVFVRSTNIQGFILNTIDSGSSKKNLKFSKNYQYTFINRRPVNPLKEICKVFDGYYKKYNPYTKYVFFLNLRVEPNQIDVNLSPNKRDIFIKKQRLDEILKQIRGLIEKEVIEKITNLEEYREAKLLKLEKKLLLQNKGQQVQEKQEQVDGEESSKNKKPGQKEKQQSINIDMRRQAFRSNIGQSVQGRVMKGNYLANYRPINNSQELNSSAIMELNRRINSANINSKVNTRPLGSVQQNNGKYNNGQKEPKKEKSYEVNSESENQEEENSQSIDAKVQQYRCCSIQGVDSMQIKNLDKLRDNIFSTLSKSIYSKQAQKQSQNQLKTQSAKKQHNPQEDSQIMTKRIQFSYRSKPIEIHDLQKIQEMSENHSLNVEIKNQKNRDYVVKRQQQERNEFIVPKMEVQILNSGQKQDQSKSSARNEERGLELDSHINQHSCCSSGNDPHKIEELIQQKLPNSIIHSNFSQSSLPLPALNYITCQTNGQISKSDFKNFHIHGQFNKGFILCSLNSKKYLYIVDQHASQEKRLFEGFMDSRPEFYYLSKEVQITPIMVDQIEIAREELLKSGFTFSIENRNVLRIGRCPSHFRKNFGLQQFIHIAETGKNIKDIPSFYNSAASRACRSAVMIGDQLGKGKMVDIVHKMADLKSPWNCPHGRPSLVSLGSFKSIISKIKSPPIKAYKF